MNILLILHEQLDLNSGSAGSTLNIGKCYQELGHHVWYFSNDDLPKKYNRHLKRVLFPVYVLRYLENLLKAEAIDVIDSSPCDTWLWAIVSRRFHRHAPLLVTRSHGLLHFDHIQYRLDGKLGNVDISWKYPFYHGSFHIWEETYTLRHSDLVFMLNSQEATYAQKELKINANQVFVFPNGLPDRFVDLPFIDTPLAPEAPIHIAQIGTFTQRKGIDYSVPALHRILEQYPNVHVSFIGTELNGVGDVDSVYSCFSEQVRDRVRVISYYTHKTLPDLLQGHYIKLFPTLSEGFGKVLIEAMACGLAPITTHAPGPKDIVQEGHDALIVPTRDSHSIEQAIERLLCDRPYLHQLRCNAYATAQNYSWKHIAQQRLSVYEQALVKQQELASLKSC